MSRSAGPRAEPSGRATHDAARRRPVGVGRRSRDSPGAGRQLRRRLVVQRRAVDQAGGVAVVDGHLGAGPEAGAGEPPVLGQAVELDVEVGPALGVAEPRVAGSSPRPACTPRAPRPSARARGAAPRRSCGSTGSAGSPRPGRSSRPSRPRCRARAPRPGSASRRRGRGSCSRGPRSSSRTRGRRACRAPSSGSCRACGCRRTRARRRAARRRGARSSRCPCRCVSFQWSQICRASSVSRLTSGNAVRPGELQGPLADEQAVVGPLHHQPRDGRRVHDVAERRRRRRRRGSGRASRRRRARRRLPRWGCRRSRRCGRSGRPRRSPRPRSAASSGSAPALISSIAFSTVRRPLRRRDHDRPLRADRPRRQRAERRGPEARGGADGEERAAVQVARHRRSPRRRVRRSEPSAVTVPDSAARAPHGIAERTPSETDRAPASACPATVESARILGSTPDGFGVGRSPVWE